MAKKSGGNSIDEIGKGITSGLGNLLNASSGNKQHSGASRSFKKEEPKPKPTQKKENKVLKFLNDKVVQPVAKTVDKYVVQPITKGAEVINDKVVQPVAKTVDKYVVQPITKGAEVINDKVVQPVAKTVDKYVV